MRSHGRLSINNDSRIHSEHFKRDIQTPTRAHHTPRIEDDTPLLARDVDLIASSTQKLKEKLASTNHTSDSKKVGALHIMFLLPASVRKNIYRHCFVEESRKISLSPHFATKAIFPEGHFASPWTVLHPVHGAIQAFSLIRNELMEYFWSEFHFHVTLSMFSGPKFSPLSHAFLPQHIHIVQYMTLEIDLTRFGGSTLQKGHQFGHNCSKIEKQIAEMIDGLLQRTDSAGISELNLMCRRYLGLRPSFKIKDESVQCPKRGDKCHDPIIAKLIDHSLLVPYCPSDLLHLCEPLSKLKGVLQRSQISGFPLNYTLELFSVLFAANYEKAVSYTTPTESAWPPPPAPIVHTPASFIHTPVLKSASHSPNKFEIALPSSPSFAQLFEEEMVRYSSSDSSNYTLVSDGILSDDATNSETYSHIYETTTTMDARLRTPRTFSSNAASYMPSNTSHESSPRIRFADRETSPSVNCHALMVPVGEHVPKRLTPSPDTMNKLNELDPAFLRTVHALGITDIPNGSPPKSRPFSDPIIPKLTDDSPSALHRTSTSTQQRSEDSSKRYPSFFSRFRARPLSG